MLAVTFAPEHQRALEKRLAGLPAEVFAASDSLGWVYQFWQAKRKDEVNASEVKIGADELPAVTQLFTEPYMVEFLLHNSLGAWWVTRHPDQSCPVPLPYLRRLRRGRQRRGLCRLARFAPRVPVARSLLWFRAFSGRRPPAADADADGDGRAVGAGGGGCGAAREPARTGIGPALCGNRRVCAGAGGLDLSRCGWISPLAAAPCRVLRRR